MLLNKKIFIVSIFLISITTFCQPGPSKYFFDVNFTIRNSDGKNVIFNTKDSVHFFNKKNKLNFSIYETFDKELNKKNYLKLNCSRWFYVFKMKNNIFYLKNITKIIFDELNTNNKSTIIEIYKNNKKMLIYFNFKEFKKYIQLKELNINFQEGSFELTNTEKSELVKIKT